MRRAVPFVLSVMILAPAALAAGSRFLAPPQGAQLYGREAIEIASDTPSISRVDFHLDGKLIGVARTAPWKIVHDFGDSGAGSVISATIHSDSFRRSETITLHAATVAISDQLSVDMVEISLRATSRRPRIEPADLTVTENGVPQRVVSLAPARGPMKFLFVLDRSLSMGDGKIGKSLEAIQRALSMMRPDDTASLITFNHRVAGRIDLRKGSDLPDESALSPSGGTSLRDALASIDENGSTSVIVLTDGADRNSVASEESAMQRIGGSRTTVYGVALGRGDGADFLRKAAARTGGTFVESSPGRLERSVVSIIEDINSRYTLAYQSTHTEPGWRSISVRPSRSGISVASGQRGYFAE